MTTLPKPVLPNLGPLFGAMYLGATGAAMYVPITYRFIAWTYLRVGFTELRCFKFTSISGIISKIGCFWSAPLYTFGTTSLHPVIWTITEWNARLLDTLHMAFSIAELWHYLIDSFGNYAALQVIVWCVQSLELLKLPVEFKALQDSSSELISTACGARLNYSANRCRYYLLCVQSYATQAMRNL